MSDTMEEYLEWIGAGKADPATVYSIDENKKSVKKLEEDEWGSLTEYLPTGSAEYKAARELVVQSTEEMYLRVRLEGGGWANRLKNKIEDMKFTFTESPKIAAPDNLSVDQMQVMDAGEQITLDAIDWEPIQEYNVELFRTELPDEVVYTLKLYLQKVDDPTYRVGAFWCWR